MRRAEFRSLFWGILILWAGTAESAPSTASTLYQQGLRLLQSGHPREALAYLQQATQRDPLNARFIFSQAVAHSQLQHQAEAFDLYQRALTAFPDPDLKAHIQSGMGDIYFRMEAYTQAVSAYQQAIFVLPTLKGVRFRLAIAYLSLKNYTFALQEIETLLQQDPLFKEGYYLRSLIQLSLSDDQQALRDLQKAKLSTRQEDLLFQIQLNSLYVLNRDFTQAEAHAQEMVRNYAPKHPEVYLMAGDVFFNALSDCRTEESPCLLTAHLQQAETYYEKYILAAPEQALGHYKLARLHLWQKMPQSALIFARRAEALFPGYPDGQVLWILNFLSRKSPQVQMLNMRPDSLSTTELEKLSMMQEADFPLPFSEKQIAQSPQTSEMAHIKWFFYRGYLKYLQAQKNPEAAEREWSTVVQQEPSGALADLIRALRMRATGQLHWAQQLLDQAARKAPDWWLPPRILGDLLFEQKDFNGAWWALDQSIRRNPLSRQAFFKAIEAARLSGRSKDWLENLKYSLVFFPTDSDFQRWYWEFLKQETRF